MNQNPNDTNPQDSIAHDQGAEEERFPHWRHDIDAHLDLEFEMLREAGSIVVYGIEHVLSEMFDRYDALFRSQLDQETYDKWRSFDDIVDNITSEIRYSTINTCRLMLPNLPTKLRSYADMVDEALRAINLQAPEDADRIAESVGIRWIMERAREVFPDIDPESWRYRVARQQIREGMERRQQAERDAGVWAILSSGAREWVSDEEAWLIEIYRSADGQGKRVIMAYVRWISTLQGPLPEYSEELVQEIYAECWEQIDYNHHQTARTLVREFLNKAGEAND